VVVANAVIDRMQRMQATFVPQDIQVVVTRNDGQKADDAVNLLLEHLAIALVTVGLVLILFLGWREALIVMITVPLIMGITLAANLLGGVTINRVTLFALILALGLLVDAAIVVIENIHRHYASRKPKADKEAETVLATNEIGNATNLATFAVMLVFITLLLALTGMPRQYFSRSRSLCRSPWPLPSWWPTSSCRGHPIAGFIATTSSRKHQRTGNSPMVMAHRGGSNASTCACSAPCSSTETCASASVWRCCC